MNRIPPAEKVGPDARGTPHGPTLHEIQRNLGRPKISLLFIIKIYTAAGIIYYALIHCVKHQIYSNKSVVFRARLAMVVVASLSILT